MLRIDKMPDLANCPSGVDGEVEARVYYALGYTRESQGVVQLTMGNASFEEESPNAIFEEVRQRLRVFLNIEQPIEPKQVAAFCLLKEFDSDQAESPNETTVARLGSYVVVRANEQRPVAIQPISSRDRISRWGYGQATQGEGIIGIHSLIHLPITDEEAANYPQVTHILKAAPRVGGVFQPYVALHSHDVGRHAIEQKLLVD